MPALNQPRFSASLIVCENKDIYCFGGVDNDPKDPTKFTTLRSIETLNIEEESKGWDVLKLQLPYKTSSPGAISLGFRAFVVFGGWNKDPLKQSIIIRSTNEAGEYSTEESGDMGEADSFVSSGLVSRNAEERTIMIFGTSHAHQFDEKSKTFSLID